ncbi:TetR family transcriptional regulator [Mycobacterium dioxanotrophicus]|uniref:TetR family transcriptional regulator n=1 Tax=Mycobacterium dioxanotrophicus TaxID=482462 RepID=UPI0038CC155A
MASDRRYRPTLLPKRMRFHITLQRQQTTALPFISGNTTPLTMSRTPTSSPTTRRTTAANWALSISETEHFHLAPSLLPQVIAPAPTSGTLRERLVELLSRQADLFAEAPLHVTTLAWAALGPTETHDSDSDTGHHATASMLRTRVIEQYRRPFDEILHSPETFDQLGELDIELALCQLVGPLVFARMTGLRAIGHHDCTRIVDDFITAQTTQRPAQPAS